MNRDSKKDTKRTASPLTPALSPLRGEGEAADRFMVPMRVQRTWRPSMKFARSILFGLLAFVVVFSARAAEKILAEENRYYQMVTIPIPQGIALEGGALQFLPDGR